MKSFKVEVIADSSGVSAQLKSLQKPRARWNSCGVGYWTVRMVRDGALYQGVGPTLPEAYAEWRVFAEESS